MGVIKIFWLKFFSAFFLFYLEAFFFVWCKFWIVKIFPNLNLLILIFNCANAENADYSSKF